MSNNPARTPAWKALEKHAKSLRKLSMRDLTDEGGNRFDKFFLSHEGLSADFSCQTITEETVARLCDLARACKVEKERERMFSGAAVNVTENRPALHTALRRPATDRVEVDGQDIIPDIHAQLARIRDFSDNIRDAGKIRHVVNIGIGGSDLGPRLVCEALAPYAHPGIAMHFVSNADGAEIDSVLKSVDPDSTLFLVASKTFTTQETMANAATARAWLVERRGAAAIADHFAALSTNARAVSAFGIRPENMFPFRDWVGGRYSLWSSIGLSIAISCGFDRFRALLDGAHAMDTHFCEAPLESNIPVFMALTGIWQRNFRGCAAHAVIPYDSRLSRLPAYLQQLEMESNGKSVDSNGRTITDYRTAPVVFGVPGTDAQHSFFQMIHQGTDVIPVDFIAACTPDHPHDAHHRMLLTNMAAQARALMHGRTLEEANGNPYRVFPGNRPSTTILLEKLDPYHLGMLLAAYEHKVFVQGIIWNINSFDQFGVELGKEMALAEAPDTRAS